MLEKLTFSEHALIRMAQRKISETDIEYIMHTAHDTIMPVVFFAFLAKRISPTKSRKGYRVLSFS